MIAMDPTVLATGISAAACAVLVLAEWRAHASLRVVAKLVASAAFIAIGLEMFHIGHGGGRVAYAHWIFVGLVFGALGDVFLLGSSKRAFLGGLVAFLIGHVAYVAAALERVPLASWPAAAGAGALIVISVGAIALGLLWRHLGSLRIPVIAYVLVIVTMVIGAIAVMRAHALPDPQRLRLLVGACLFFVSDLAVARNRFVVRAFSNKLWGLPAYYAGQILIAWSLVGL